MHRVFGFVSSLTINKLELDVIWKHPILGEVGTESPGKFLKNLHSASINRSWRTPYEKPKPRRFFPDDTKKICLAGGLIVFGRLDKEIRVTRPIDEGFRQRRRNAVEFRNTHDLL